MAVRFIRRLSRRGSEQQEPEFDFRPTSGKNLMMRSAPAETTNFETLARAEVHRLSHGGGGAVVGDVEWVPDPLTGGQRALLRPVSGKVLEKQLAESEATAEEAVREPSQHDDADTDGEEELPAKPAPSRKGKGKSDEDPMANMTAEEKAAYAKRTIESAIEAERSALEKKLTIKKKSGGTSS